MEGNWWIPSNPGVKWHGVLVLEAAKMATLRLIEYGKSFLQSDINPLPAVRKIIHGMTKDGKAVTLLKCFSSHRNQTFESREIHFDVKNAIFGHHFEETDLVFDAIQIEFDYLDDWITYSRFEAKDMNDRGEQKEIRIRLNQDHQIPFQVPDYAESQFYIGYRSKYSAFKFTIESRANLQITYQQKQPFEVILKDIKRWEWFLTLATAHKNNPLSLSVHRENLRFDLGNKTFKKPYEVWLSTQGKRESKKALHSPDMAFTLPDIRKDLSQILSRWRAMQTPWAAVLHRYFASIHRKDIQLQEQFLFRAQAMEAIARVDSKSNSITQKAAYGAAWERATPDLKTKLGEKNFFIEAVRVNRNYLTHYDPGDEEKAFDFAALFDLTQKMGFLLQAIILAEMGLPEALIDCAIDDWRWGHLVQFDDEARQAVLQSAPLKAEPRLFSREKREFES